jgi:hypothetical protein
VAIARKSSGDQETGARRHRSHPGILYARRWSGRKESASEDRKKVTLI